MWDQHIKNRPSIMHGRHRLGKRSPVNIPQIIPIPLSSSNLLSRLFNIRHYYSLIIEFSPLSFLPHHRRSSDIPERENRGSFQLRNFDQFLFNSLLLANRNLTSREHLVYYLDHRDGRNWWMMMNDDIIIISPQFTDEIHAKI